MISDLFTTFDPELKITAPEKRCPKARRNVPYVGMKEVDVVCEVLEEKSLVEYGDRQVTATVKG
ncbi:hypothetical protein MASR1M31_10190 [Porphyromonadaceae bacterium]